MRLTMTVSLPQRASSIGEARDMLAVLLRLTPAEEPVCDRLAVVLTEACANVVQHGAPGTTIDLHVTVEDGTCVLEIGNRGRGPGSGPLVARPPNPAQPSGRGLALIAALSDGAEFVPAPSGYVLLRITLQLEAPTRTRAADPFGP